MWWLKIKDLFKGKGLVGVVLSVITTLIGLLAIFIPRSVKRKESHKKDAKDTREQVKLDREDEEKSDEEASLDYIDHFRD